MILFVCLGYCDLKYSYMCNNIIWTICTTRRRKISKPHPKGHIRTSNYHPLIMLATVSPSSAGRPSHLEKISIWDSITAPFPNMTPKRISISHIFSVRYQSGPWRHKNRTKMWISWEEASQKNQIGTLFANHWARIKPETSGITRELATTSPKKWRRYWATSSSKIISGP